MRILFVTANRLGDAVLSTGLLDHLIRTGPTARFKTVTRRWDLVVDIRGSALSWLILTKRRAVMVPRSGPKTVQLAQVLELQDTPMPVVWFSAEDSARAAALMPADPPVIALAPTANWAPKVWPAERFAALYQRLSETHIPGAVPAVLAGPGETEALMAKPVLQALPNAIDLVGRLSLPEIAAFLSRASLFVGNDSGLMHLAAAAGTPTLGLFGPTDAVEYGPAGRRRSVVIGTDAQMASISVDAVVEAAARLLTA
jgi:heptosyltransferase-3